jgi:hypothetical protein
MSYWDARKDLRLLQDYKQTVQDYWAEKANVNRIIGESGYPKHRTPREVGLRINQQTAPYRQRVAPLRERIAILTPRVTNLARRLGIGTGVTSFPAPAVGGPVLRFDIFDAILRDPSHGAVVGERIPEQDILDKLNAAIGAADERVKTEWHHLINPLYWIKSLFIFILRLPVNLIGLAGFNISKFEEHFWGKLFNLLWIAAMIGFLVWLGLGKADLIDLVKKMITKG